MRCLFKASEAKRVEWKPVTALSSSDKLHRWLAGQQELI